MRSLLMIALPLMLASCFGPKPRVEPPLYNEFGIGWKAIYGADTAYKKLRYQSGAVPMNQPGKIYVRGNTIYQNDISKGIHIIDNSNPANAHRVGFIDLPGNTEMAVKGNYLYANNFSDLVVIDISNSTAPVEVKRLKEMFISYNMQNPYPWQAPSEPGYYECPRMNNDSVIVGWVMDSIILNCYK